MGYGSVEPAPIPRQHAAGADAAGGLISARPEPAPDVTGAIFVRLLRPHEHALAGTILGLAFADKYSPALGGDPDLAAAVAAIMPAGGQIYLALLDGQAAGTA